MNLSTAWRNGEKIFPVPASDRMNSNIYHHCRNDVILSSGTLRIPWSNGFLVTFTSTSTLHHDVIVYYDVVVTSTFISVCWSRWSMAMTWPCDDLESPRYGDVDFWSLFDLCVVMTLTFDDRGMTSKLKSRKSTFLHLCSCFSKSRDVSINECNAPYQPAQTKAETEVPPSPPDTSTVQTLFLYDRLVI